MSFRKSIFRIHTITKSRNWHEDGEAILKKIEHGFLEDFSEHEYLNLLKELFFREVQREITRYEAVEIRECNEEIGECLIQFEKNN